MAGPIRRASTWSRGTRSRPTTDRLAAPGARRLAGDGDPAGPRAVERIGWSGGHSGNAQPAGLAEEVLAGAFDVVEVAQAGLLGDLANQRVEQRLPPRQRDAAQIVTVEIGEIEEVVGQDGGAFAGQRPRQRLRIGV